MRPTRGATWRTVIASAIVVAAAVAGGRGVYVALSGEPAGKSGPTTTSEASPPPLPPAPGDEPTVSLSPAPDVPAVAVPPAGVSCPSGWRYFDNPVLHYGVCYPPGWGFTDYSDPDPMTTIPGKQLESLHLASEEAFPWRTGRSSFDAITEGGMIDVELNLLSDGAGASSECDPSEPLTAGDLTLLWCEETYNDLGLVDPTGPIRALKVVVPLRSDPLPTQQDADREGARLLVIARVSVATYSRAVALIWQLAKTVRPY